MTDAVRPPCAHRSPGGLVTRPTAGYADSLAPTERRSDVSEQLGGHPESTCRRCGRSNIPWTAPSPLWNYVMREGSIDGPWKYGELICPVCFAELALRRGVAASWRFAPSTPVDVDLELVTPSGRVWNAETWLWEEPT